MANATVRAILLTAELGHAQTSNFHCQFSLKNSLKIHEENTKKITAVLVVLYSVLYVIKFHVNLHKLYL